MKILYLANIRLPTDKAHGLQIMKTCEAFAQLGHEVELVVPWRANDISESPFAYYGVKPIFKITTLWNINLVETGKFGYRIQNFLFGITASRYARSQKPDLVYGRDEDVLYIASKMGIRVIAWESHTGAWNFFARKLAQSLKALVVISKGLGDLYTKHDVPKEKIVLAPDAIDLQEFANPESKEAARKRLGLPLEAKIALYIGRVDGWKGIDTLCEAATFMQDVKVVVIGGEPDQVKELKQKYPLITFLGFKPYTELVSNQAAADVLVLPNTGKDIISSRYTSPLKLFTYMASNRPIVASDLPSIREVLDESTAVLVNPDNAQALAKGIQNVLENPHLGESIARAAREKVQNYTWQNRAQRILDFIKR